MRILIIVVLLLTFSLGDAYALSCLRTDPLEFIKQYDLIFRGISSKSVPTGSYPNSKTTFIIEENIKGPNFNEIDIYHSVERLLDDGPRVSGMTREFEENTEYIVFASYRKDKDFYSVGGCSPMWKASQLENARYPFDTGILLEIQKYQSLKEGLDKLIKEYDIENHYLSKAELHEEYNDYLYAKNIYELLIKREVQAIKLKLAQDDSAKPLEEWRKLQSTRTKQCNDFSKETPKFIQEIILPIRDYSGGNLSKYLALYGRILYKMDEYELAYKPLCLAAANRGDSTYKTLNNIKLGLKEEIQNQNINLKDVELKNVDLNDHNLQKAQFSNSNLYNISFNGSNMSSADFAESELVSVDFRGANLQEANFLNTTLRNVDFAYADVKGIDFSSTKMDERTLNSFQFTNNSYNSDTIWPDGVSIRGHRLINESAN